MVIEWEVGMTGALEGHGVGSGSGRHPRKL